MTALKSLPDNCNIRSISVLASPVFSQTFLILWITMPFFQLRPSIIRLWILHFSRPPVTMLQLKRRDIALFMLGQSRSPVPLPGICRYLERVVFLDTARQEWEFRLPTKPLPLHQPGRNPRGASLLFPTCPPLTPGVDDLYC